MTRKKYIKLLLILGIFSLSFGGWLLHFRIHSPFAESYNLIPFIIGLIGIFIVPFLFWFKQTIAYAYLINGFSVILGTILMGHYSLVHLHGSFTLNNLLFGTLFADIVVLWGKFYIGKVLFELEWLRSDQDPAPEGRYFRYPNMGFWWVHFLSWSIVYTIGSIFL